MPQYSAYDQYQNLTGQEVTATDPNKLDQNTQTYGATKGFLTFVETEGLTSSQLLSGFGVPGYSDLDKAMVQTFEDQYGWKTDQMKQNMYAGVGQAMGTAGTSLQQMREQSASLASQSGLRRGRGAGLQQENIYDQYTQGLSGLQSQTQQGIESMKHQWYDELTDTMGAITRARNE